MAEPSREMIRRLFDLVIGVQASQRDSVLDRECGGDEDLKRRVRDMVAAAGREASTGDVTIDPTPAGRDSGGRGMALRPPGPPEESVGESIGRYKLLELIGEGGFGSVWAAEQRVPVRRRVAIKIIKLGMDTKQVIARFEAERQALAMMDHPNIARVLDAGATDTGRPFFAMELVKGVPILEYCDRENLDTKARLDLFMKVCHAIQHAHQKGIIHRDIKPENVLVTLHDGMPVPKVIDFGIAKATNQELTDKTIYTQHHQMIGTPAYMSPEQAEMSGLDIDTRSDIYALGVLLYELLTGTTPFKHQELMERGLAEMMRIIREETPDKPSTRLSTLGDARDRTAQQRRTDVKRLNLTLKGDLDWIVMRCLEKDRTRRYETATGLAADIQRHLGNEPVSAGPPSATYKLAKFVRRNRTGVIAGGSIAVLMVLGVVGTSSGLVWALDEKERADEQAIIASLATEAEQAARILAEENEQRAIDEADRAERELARANEIKQLIVQMLQSVSPEQAQGADVTLLQGILDSAATRLANGEVEDKLVMAELRAVIGDVYRRLGLFPEAEEHLPEVFEVRRLELGDEHPDTQMALSNLIVLYWDQGERAKLEPLLLEVLDRHTRILGEDHPLTLTAMNNLATLYSGEGRLAEAEPLVLRAYEIRKRVLGEEHISTLGSMSSLAMLSWNQGRTEEAEAQLQRVMGLRAEFLGEDHHDTVASRFDLVRVYTAGGRYAEAEPLAREVLETRTRLLGEEHPDTLSAMASLAAVYKGQRRTDEAASMLQSTVAGQKRVLGEEHPVTLASMSSLAEVLGMQGKSEEAESLFATVAEKRSRVIGERHPDTLWTLSSLASLHAAQGRYEEAESLMRGIAAVRTQDLGEDHPWTLAAVDSMVYLLQVQEKLAEAESYVRAAMERQRRVLGDDHPETLGKISNLALLLADLGRGDAALELADEAVAASRRVLGDTHWNVGNFLGKRGRALQVLGRFGESAEAMEQGHAILAAELGADHEQSQRVVGYLADLYDAWDAAEPGAGHDATADEWRAQRSPPGASDG